MKLSTAAEFHTAADIGGSQHRPAGRVCKNSEFLAVDHWAHFEVKIIFEDKSLILVFPYIATAWRIAGGPGAWCSRALLFKGFVPKGHVAQMLF